MVDSADIQHLLAPDVIILDEAQRIKNWQTKTAQAVKKLKSPYAFVLTGTPLENRIDDVYSIVQFLDPHLFGPLFRFNRDFYVLDEKGKPTGYKNLTQLHQRLKPVMLRRRKGDVEGDLPPRTINNYFVSMADEQRKRYEEYDMRVAKILMRAKNRPLLKEEFEQLQRSLSCMRMLCDTPYILDSDCRISPKLHELENILEELLTDDSCKIIIFSEWERMLSLIRELAEKMKIGFAWHTGSVNQDRRRVEINRFKDDEKCRLFLSTDAGSVGLNLQTANVVINVDLPWNPAKLEQRIARAWRKHQTRSVQIINLICEDSIEHRMLSLLAQKQQLAQAVLDGEGDMENITLPSGRAAFLDKMQALMGNSTPPLVTVTQVAPQSVDHTQQFCEDTLARYAHRLDSLQVHTQPEGKRTLLAVVDQGAPILAADLSQLLEKHNQGSDQLEVLDRATYALLERLAAAGIISFTQNTRLHEPAYQADILRKQKEQWHKTAQTYLQQASRKQKMAQVLKESGFEEEALQPLREALTLHLQGLLWLHGQAETPHVKEHFHGLDQLLIHLPKHLSLPAVLQDPLPELQVLFTQETPHLEACFAKAEPFFGHTQAYFQSHSYD